MIVPEGVTHENLEYKSDEIIDITIHKSKLRDMKLVHKVVNAMLNEYEYVVMDPISESGLMEGKFRLYMMRRL